MCRKRGGGVVIVLYPYEVGDGVCMESIGPRGLLNREVVYPPLP